MVESLDFAVRLWMPWRGVVVSYMVSFDEGFEFAATELFTVVR